MHVTTECFNPTSVAIGLRKNFALRPLFNRQINALREAELIEKWLQDVEKSAGNLAEDLRAKR